MQTHSLPTPNQLRHELSPSTQQMGFIQNARKKTAAVLNGTDPRFLLIVGPCSIHDIAAAREYAQRLQELNQTVSDSILLVMRVYVEKARTSLGWKGLLYDPHLNGSNDIVTGIRLTRQLLLDLADMEIPAATEFLDPATAPYYSDLITWGCVGARTASSQTHRQMASALPMPIAIKNNTDGNTTVAVQGVMAASMPHTFVGADLDGKLSQVHSLGNPDAHVVLRGGEGQPNYDPQSIAGALNKLEKAQMPLRLIVDCAHDNSFKMHEQQCHVFQSIVHQVIEGNKCIRGAILESNLFAGNQHLTADPAALQYAVSVTDPCLDFDSTKKLILWCAEKLKQETHASV